MQYNILKFQLSVHHYVQKNGFQKIGDKGIDIP